MRKRIVGNDGMLERTQQIILTKSGNFHHSDIKRVLTILSDAAESHLKVINSRTFKNPFAKAKVTGEGEVQGNMLIMRVELPLDLSEQTDLMVKAFNNDWSNQVHNKLSVTSGGFVPQNLQCPVSNITTKNNISKSKSTEMLKGEVKLDYRVADLINKPKGINADLTYNLTRIGKFAEKDISRATEVVEFAAQKFLKLRSKSGVFSKVKGEGSIYENTMELNIHLPLDTRYTQPDPTDFNKTVNSVLKRKLTLTAIK